MWNATDELTAGAARQAISSEWFDRLARFGYVCKGVVFGAVGVLAARSALGAGDEDADFSGALEALSEQPTGAVLLVFLSLGLFGYACWRFVQALADAERKGRSARGLFMRAAYLVIGLLYGGWAVYGIGTLAGWRSGDGQEQTIAAATLAQPFGPWLVGAVGIVLIVGGLKELYVAFTHRFKREFKSRQMHPVERVAARLLGWFGHATRGAVFCAAGFYVVRAAVTFDASEARGFADTLEQLANRPHGPWVLAAAAAGLIAFGAYSIMLAVHRDIRNAEAVDET